MNIRGGEHQGSAKAETPVRGNRRSPLGIKGCRSPQGWPVREQARRPYHPEVENKTLDDPDHALDGRTDVCIIPRESFLLRCTWIDKYVNIYLCIP